MEQLSEPAVLLARHTNFPDIALVRLLSLRVPCLSSVKIPQSCKPFRSITTCYNNSQRPTARVRFADYVTINNNIKHFRQKLYVHYKLYYIQTKHYTILQDIHTLHDKEILVYSSGQLCTVNRFFSAQRSFMSDVARVKISSCMLMTHCIRF